MRCQHIHFFVLDKASERKGNNLFLLAQKNMLKTKTKLGTKTFLVCFLTRFPPPLIWFQNPTAQNCLPGRSEGCAISSFKRKKSIFYIGILQITGTEHCAGKNYHLIKLLVATTVTISVLFENSKSAVLTLTIFTKLSSVVPNIWWFTESFHCFSFKQSWYETFRCWRMRPKSKTNAWCSIISIDCWQWHSTQSFAWIVISCSKHWLFWNMLFSWHNIFRSSGMGSKDRTTSWCLMISDSNENIQLKALP